MEFGNSHSTNGTRGDSLADRDTVTGESCPPPRSIRMVTACGSRVEAARSTAARTSDAPSETEASRAPARAASTSTS